MNDVLSQIMFKRIKQDVTYKKGKIIEEGYGTQKRVIGCMLAVPLALCNSSPYDVVSIGVSLCNTDHDVYDDKIGKELATGMLWNPFEKYTFPNKMLSHNKFLKDEVTAFMNRCKAYYKDKIIVSPRIRFYNLNY